jgi:hypothetical protein
MWLQPAMSRGYLFQQSIFEALSLLVREAMHVSPNLDRFHAWLTPTLKRLVQWFPAAPEDPLEDLFDHQVGQRLGPLIGRKILDPAVVFEPSFDIDFLAQMLRHASDEENPFLATPDDLEEVGFVGVPYVLPT